MTAVQRQLCGATRSNGQEVCAQPWHHVTGHIFQGPLLRAYDARHLINLLAMAEAVRWSGTIIGPATDGWRSVYEFDAGTSRHFEATAAMVLAMYPGEDGR